METEADRERGSDNNLCLIDERRLNSSKLPETHQKIQEDTVAL